ncbi:hypothetical protein G6011_08763 [Alternaria panax]|uniref:Uncharacterized protein n=1 Tax=Alternaria panax TaxID=48097 RepID=A0AAD4FIP5_9PLEO|nr:hypothetical protein G6011_08763 [Alternaria panax]
MASHGKVLDLLDDRYLELQDVVGNVEPLPTLVPYEQYKQHAIVYRMDTNHDIFMALLQDFTERKSLETGKELWTWFVQWEVDQTAARQPVVAPHSPKKPRLDFNQLSTPTTQPPSRRGAPPITAQVRKIDPELMHQEDMLRTLVDIVQVNSTVVPNFIEFLYRWIDFYEGDGKALNAALYEEIPSLWDFEYHPILVPEDVRKNLDEANGINRDGKKNGAGNETPKHVSAEELAQNSPTKKMRQKPDLATLERKAEESERLQYHEVHFGIQPPKLNEPLPPLINIPRDRIKRAKYHVACFKSRQRALYLLIEAGVTPQQLKDYNRCQTMSLKDTPPREGADGLENYEKDANLAQMIHSAKEKHRVKQMEIAISNKLADEAQLAGRSTVPAGPSGVPLIPATPSNTHRPGMAGQILRKIQQTKDEREQRINIVPVPLVGKMKSKLFEGAMDRAVLLEICGHGGGSPNPCSSAIVDHHEPKNDDNGGGRTHGESVDDTSASRGRTRTLPSPSLPPTLPRPNLPPPPGPTPILMATQSRSSLNPSSTLSSQQQYPFGHSGPSASGPAPPRTPIPPHVTEIMRNITPNQACQLIPALDSQENLAASGGRAQKAVQNGQASVQSPQSISSTGSNASNMIQEASNAPTSIRSALYPRTSALAVPLPPTINVSHPQFQAQHPPPIAFGGSLVPYRARTPPAPPGFENDSPFTFGNMPPHLQPPPPSTYPSAQSQSNTCHLNLLQQIQTPPYYPVGPGFSIPAPPPSFAQRLLAQSHAASYHQGNQNTRPPLSRVPNMSTLNGPVSQLRSAQERQQGSHTLLLNPPALPPPRVNMQRNTPSPLTLRPPPSPLSSLAPSLLATSPFTASHQGIPIQIYLPRILIPSNIIGPGGMKLGNNGCAETDAFLLGHTHPISGKITLSRAVFLPLGVWTNAQDRVRKGKYRVLESYIAPTRGTSAPHRAVYERLRQAYGTMKTGSPAARERELTKRWRTSRGRMKETERGAVWEGWAVDIDREIAMNKEDRTGAFVQDALIDGINGDSEEARRRKEIDELLETDEAWDYDDDDVHMNK